MSKPNRFVGRCGCGGVRFAVSGEPSQGCYCHCRSCQLASGAHCVAWITFPTASFELLAGELSTWRSSEPVTRGYCRDCGTALTYSHTERPDDIDIATVALDSDDTRLAPTRHIWMDDARPWDRVDDGLPAFARWS